MDKLIKVYKASAGSGKTYTLTNEYIDIILKDEQAYKHVLAVTFTNKATDEMKRRIIKRLYEISCDPSNEHSQKAKKVLVRILHDYPAFAVSTIDRFFQSVMRSFARELGRMVTYRVELDSNMVRTAAVDNMFADLDMSENSDLLHWLINYSLERIENGESWKIQYDIAYLSNSLFSENFKLKSPGLYMNASEQMTGIAALKTRIAALADGFKTQCKALGERALSIMDDCNLECSDFTGGSRSAFNIFIRLADGEKLGVPLKESLVKCYNNVDVWYPKSKKKESYKYEAAYSAGLNDVLGELIALYDQPFRIYKTALCVEGNLNSLAILGRIYSYILDYCKENNVVLLSETTELLGRIIDGNDTPFIYEKVGTWIDNFLLDEFQDTSLMQWKNFVPLLSNSLANGERNLIVGDVKQSIYRFRNSNWSILESGIDELFSESIKYEPMIDNWRSDGNIVRLNNDIFREIAAKAKAVYEPDVEGADKASLEKASLIPSIYSGFKQDPRPEREGKGYVSIEFVDKAGLKDLDITYEEVVEQRLLDTLEHLLDERNGYGFTQHDIGILVRGNEDGEAIARTLLCNNYRVISADSLKISSSAAITRAVNILKWIDDPDNISSSIYAALGGDASIDMVSQEESVRLKAMPLYQMCEEIVRTALTESQKSDLAFINSFLDMVLEYETKEGSNLSGFLKWWNECGSGKSIATAQDQDAIQVMTVHKAKGLDFEVVILPYFSEKLDNIGAPLLWSNAASELFGYNGPLPVRYSKDLKHTLFCEDYLKEKLEAYVDNLNLAYVAFTRPVKWLSVIAERPNVTTKGELQQSAVSHLIYDFLSTGKPQENYKIEKDSVSVDVCGENVELERFTVGTPAGAGEKKRESYSWFELGNQLCNPLDMDRSKTSLQTGSINDNLTLRDNGIIMHDIFAAITNIEDVERIEPESVRMQVKQMIDSVSGYGWFSKENKVYKEASIINPDGSILRPDRVVVNGTSAVVVDYKFGEYVQNNRTYHKQVRRYMQLLMDMGFTSVKGFLWYPMSSEVESV